MKAIHNEKRVACIEYKLYYLIQRYKFESNSQPDIWNNRKFNVVLSDTKIQIWKQFTTRATAIRRIATLYYLIQRYKFESNSQLIIVGFDSFVCCIIWYKDTNLKAIHNPKMRATMLLLLYYLIQRYKFESNSQQESALMADTLSCIIWYKDTNLKAIHNYLLWEYTSACVVLSDTKIQIWKQFTTVQAQPNTDILLYYLIQRYKFESN